MSRTLEEIALQIGKEVFGAVDECLSGQGERDREVTAGEYPIGEGCIEFARRLVAALGAQEVDYRSIADAIVGNLEERSQVIDLDLEEELVEEIMQEIADTIRDGVRAPQLSQLEGWQMVPKEQLDILIQSITEMAHARRNPNWFTKGKQGADNQWYLWEQRGLEAIKTIAAAPEYGK